MPPVPPVTEDTDHPESTGQVETTGHLIVCGDDALAYRVVEELATNYGERVTVLLGSVSQHVVHHAPCPVVIIRDREI